MNVVAVLCVAVVVLIVVAGVFTEVAVMLSVIILCQVQLLHAKCDCSLPRVFLYAKCGCSFSSVVVIFQVQVLIVTCGCSMTNAVTLCQE